MAMKEMQRGRGAVMSATALFAALSLPLCTSAAAQAQESSDGAPWYVTTSKWGKWGALAGAIGFTSIAVLRSSDANDVFGGLETLCINATEACRIQGNGTYVDATAETLYQETLRIDRQARLWTIAGQISLMAAGAMFLIDLVHDDGEPDNIPFAPFEVMAGPQRVGLRVRF